MKGAAVGFPSTALGLLSTSGFAGLPAHLLGKCKRMWLNVKLLVVCRGPSAVALPLVGAESVWVGLGEIAA